MSRPNDRTPASHPRESAMKRKVDDRVKRLIDDVVQRKHRGLFLIVGDRAKDQIVNLHWILSCARHNAKINVLWCMKEEPDFGSTGKKQQERRARLEVKGGLSTEASKDAFQTFLSHTSIRFCKYKETHKILGQTFDMAVLQDFEALTPNTLARTVETVRGGGLVILMLRGLQSLKQLYMITMDVHAHYRTDALRTVVPRFNERFLLSLTDCETVLCVDDDLHVLPITQKMRDYGRPRDDNNKGAVRVDGGEEKTAAALLSSPATRYDAALALQGRLEHEAKLQAVQSTLRSSRAVGPLVQLCQTLDQAKTVLALMQTVSEKSLDTTCVVTAARGRGKSAALGMAAAGAIAQGYSNIFCTAPSPENMQTFFEFAARGLRELGYAERSEFEVLEGASEEFSHCVIRINVFRGHRQTIQFVAATDARYFAQAELAIIDEAAALPLPLVKKMLGPYLVFVASTVSGYEGTGRSLSLKLIADMRRRANMQPASHTAAAVVEDGGVGVGAIPVTTPNTRAKANANTHHSDDMHRGGGGGVHASRGLRLRELSMTDPVRYSPHDPLERWLNTLLCLDATVHEVGPQTAPHPQACQLYHVNRDALFSYHPRAEALLQRIQALLVAAHYKNQPNDLQLLADAPGHHLFVLCAPPPPPPTSNSSNTMAPSEVSLLPDIFCVAHLCEEGRIAAERVKTHLTRGIRPSGDLIPYTLSQYFLDDSFAKLAGMRVVRIATNPELQRAGYGSRMMTLLHEYFGHAVTTELLLPSLASSQVPLLSTPRTAAATTTELADVNSAPAVSHLLTPVQERPAESLDYLGVSFGLTTELFNFWRRARYALVYVRQAAHELTGEHSGVMIHPFHFSVEPLARQFRQRFVRLLAMPFRHLPTELALSVLVDPAVHDARHLAEAAAQAQIQQQQQQEQQDEQHEQRRRRCRSDGAADAEEEFPGTNADKTVPSSSSLCMAGVCQATGNDVAALFTAAERRRLQLFTTAFLDGGNILDLVPAVAQLYFTNRLLRAPDGSDGVLLSHAQASVLCAVGLQCMTLEELNQQATFRAVPVAQLRAFYQKGLSLIIEHVLKLQRHYGDPTEKRADADVDAGEATQEMYDAEGKLTGLSVARSVTARVCADTTLLRDASKVSSGQDTEAQRDLQNVFRRPKKLRRRS